VTSGFCRNADDMRGLLRKTHRYVGLTLAVFWCIQALTGILMVFHWELDDAPFERSAPSINLNQIGARVDALRTADARWTVTSVYPTGGNAGHFDVYLANGSGQWDTVRIDGAGQVLERRPLDYDYRRAGLLRAATELHQSLFAGHRGRLIIGASGLVLLCNLIVGIKLAWPRRNQWRGALRLPGGLRGAARLYAWHRALGLWFAIPALILVLAGCCLAFDDAWDAVLGTGSAPAALAAAPATGAGSITTAQALLSAVHEFPAATIGGIILPKPAAPWFTIRLLQPGELRRVFGTTSVFISAANGAVLAREDALHAGAARRFVDGFYSIHTGEAGGIMGRIVSLSVGCWLATMLVLGICLWWRRGAQGRLACRR
jgi:uncharacterized iron-regulated membrane protein